MRLCLVLLTAFLVAQVLSDRGTQVNVSIDRHAHAQGGNRRVREVRSQPRQARTEYSSSWPNIKWGTDKVCCCTDPGEDQKCYWQERIALDTGSGCNLVGLFNPFAKKRRVTGFTDTSQSRFFVFDVRKYGSSCEADADTCAANEVVYQSKCELLQGRIELITKGAEKPHQYIVNNDFFQDIPVAVSSQPEQTSGDSTGEGVAASNPQDIGPALEIVEDSPPNLDNIEDTVEQNEDVRKAQILTTLAERQVEAMQNSLTNANLKKCERNKASKYRKIFCSKVCDMWPPMPVNSRTGVQPAQDKKGCHTVLDNDKPGERFSNVRKYCKNACEGEKEGGDCTTPESLQREYTAEGSPQKPCG